MIELDTLVSLSKPDAITTLESLGVLIAMGCVGYILPEVWSTVEITYLRIVLGESTAAESTIKCAREERAKLIQSKIEGGAPRLVASSVVSFSRLLKILPLTRDYRRMMNGKLTETFQSSFDNLIQDWREGLDPEILMGHLRRLEEAERHSSVSEEAILRAKCLRSVVQYALGDLVGGYNLGAENWNAVLERESEEESELKWLASYGRMNTMLFMGMSREALREMTNQWSVYFALLDDDRQRRLIARVKDQLILNPIFSITRHVMLATAFAEINHFPAKSWPSEVAFKSNSPNDYVGFIDSWYEEAKTLSADEIISLDLCHAYAAFAYCLVLEDERDRQEELRRRITTALDSISKATIPSQYVKFGMTGLYKLACGQDKEARELLRQAEAYGGLSGNRFADFLFKSSLAVASARLANSHLDTEIYYYLDKVKELKNSIGGNFYPELACGVEATVCALQGNHTEAEVLRLKSQQGRVGRRLLRIFAPTPLAFAA